MMKLTIHKKKPTISVTQFGYLLIIIVAVVRAIHFHVNSGDNMDLTRHFYMMQLVKKSGYSLFEYVFLYGDHFTANITMRFSYAFNLVVYLVSKYSNNFYVIVWLFVLVDYSIIAYIGLDWWKSQGGKKTSMFFVEALLCFSLLPYIHAVSGLRTAIAACIMALGVYLYIYKGKSIRTFILITILALMFHAAFLTAVPFVILAKKVDRKKGLIISFAGSVSVSLIANLLIRSSNRFLYSIAFKYLQYTGESGYRSTRFCYYGVIVICILTLIDYFLMFFWRRKTDSSAFSKGYYEKNTRIEIYDFLAYYMFFILSNIGNYEMVLRPAYLLGALAPVVTGLIYGVEGGRRRRNSLSILVFAVIVIVALYVSYMYLVWHNEYFS